MDNKENQSNNFKNFNVGTLELNRQLRPTSSNSNSTSNRQHKLKSRFTVIRKLGKGTYGKVQLAINKETGQEVAIKTIKKTKIENEQDLQRVRREIQIMSSIEHPHIIHIYEVFENKDKIVLVMQYAPGGELYEHVSQSKVLNDLEARRIFRQIATAIYYCHKNKICHRDLKLENILLDEKNNAKLADFGLSNVFDKSYQLKTFCGSPLYASPEIVQGSPYEGPEVDCWSLGVLLYTLVYGAMPFDGSNFKKLVKQISEASYFEPKQKSLASPLIRQLLCADPTKRATIIDICRDPWVNGLIGMNCNNVPLMEQSTGEQQQLVKHANLLKVAQDMASLTPVRLDILLALAPRAAAPTATSEDKKPSRKSSLAMSQKMDVDSERAASPIASYVVRDLDQTQQQQKAQEQTKEQSQQEVKMGDQSTEGFVVEIEQPTAETNVEVKNEKKLPDELMHEDMDAKMVESSDKMMTNIEDSPREEATIEETEIIDEITDQTPLVQKVTMDVDQTIDEDVSMTKEERDQSEMEQESQQKDQQIDSEQTAIGKTPEMDEKMQQEEEKQVEAEDKQQSAPEADGDKQQTDENKPKKVKRKVVIVKRKKKVPKKQADGIQTNEDSTKEEKEATISETATTKKPASTKVKGPGKVKIPNTFQSNEADGSNASEVKLGPPEARRQSALIADVSQKLLQHLQGTAANSTIKSDQPQLAKVNVSDKKDEFERRASQVSSFNSTSPISKQQQKNQQTYEPELVEAVKELINILNANNSSNTADNLDPNKQTITIEPVNRLKPLETSELMQKLILSENITPTENAVDRKLTAEERAEVERKLSECLRDLTDSMNATSSTGEATSAGSRSPLLDAIRDDRSDSVETIKAEHISLTESPDYKSPNNIRSTFLIDLSDSKAAPTEPQQTNSSQQIALQQQDLSPAPITRSYKKVTFTKDGACITETGKIYSTKADDGTVRRVERKSKITHYPADSDKPMAEHEEEIVYEQPTNPKTWQERRPTQFEKLIMPTEERFNQFDRLAERSPFTGVSSGRASSSARHQFQRADSASSCSSGSTDVFDDIFDHWTGAISMFDKPTKSLFNDDDSIFKRFNQLKSKHRNLFEGSFTPRCESADPNKSNSLRKRSNTRTRRDFDLAANSGYESDTNQNINRFMRPGSANLTRGNLFGSSNFMNEQDDLFSESTSFLQQTPLFKEHSNLKQRLRQQQQLQQKHRQLWKGSTPSLLMDDDLVGTASVEESSALNRKSGLWQYLRPQESDLKGPMSAAATTTTTKIVKQQIIKSDDVDPSQSVSSFLKQSTIQQQQQQRSSASTCDSLPPKTVRSVSKSSSITKTANEPAKYHTASFIELKRTSSSSQQHQQQQRQAQTISGSSTAQVASHSGSSSAFWDQPRVTPANTSTSEISSDQNQFTSMIRTRQQQQPEEVESQTDPASRIQSWLQNSMGNLSLSDNSTKSSFLSDSKNSTKSDPHSSINYHSLRPSRDLNVQQSTSTTTSRHSINLLPPTMPRKSPMMAPFEGQGAEEIHHSSSSTVLVSTSKTTSGDVRNEIKRDITADSALSTMEGDLTRTVSRTSSSNKVTSSKAILGGSSKSPTSSNEQQQLIQESHHHEQIQIMKQTPPVVQSANASCLQWIESSTTTSTTTAAATAISGGIAEPSEISELDLDSSSSLLDQLRSRGYRSMINQRLVGSSESGGSSPIIIRTTADNPLEETIIESSSASKVIKTTEEATTSGTTKIIKQRVVSSSSTSSGTNRDRNDNDDGDEKPQKSNDEPLKTDTVANPSASYSTNIVLEPLIMEQPEDTTPSPLKESKTGAAEIEDKEEDDEDVKAVKANMKIHLDRVKETELFLKNIHKEEEQFELQRKQMFLFNNLMLSTKLDGLKSNNINNFDLSSSSFQNDYMATSTPSSSKYMKSGAMSAPIKTNGLNGSSNFSMSPNQLTANGFIPSAALSFEPTFTIMNNSTNTNSTPTSVPFRPIKDPLEPMQPLNLHPQVYRQDNDDDDDLFNHIHRRRSRSQLSEQFEGYRYQRAAGVESSLLSSMQTSEFRSKRSVSQMRYPSGRQLTRSYQPAPIMSEYRSAFSAHLDSTSDDKCLLSPTTNTDFNRSKTPDSVSSSDDGMSAYRVSTYFPKAPTPSATSFARKGRSFQRASYQYSPRDYSPNKPDAQSPRSRRISLESNYNYSRKQDKQEETEEAPARRASVSAANEQTAASNSRLAELEKRIQENKRRREELISGKLSPIRSALKQQDSDKEIDKLLGTNKTTEAEHKEDTGKRKNASPIPLTSRLTVARPSRLESMEARIKRKSYCVRVSDCSPERTSLRQNQQSLEKWRQLNSPKNTSSHMDNDTAGSYSSALKRRDSNLLNDPASSFAKWRLERKSSKDAEDEPQDLGTSSPK